MFDDAKGPIEHFSWGRFVVAGNEHAETEDGQVGVGKDIRIIGRKVSAWRERKGHELKPKMITGVYDCDVEVLVLGLGVHSALQCPSKVRRAIEKAGITELILLPTPDACRAYNALYHEGRRVALLAHGTC